MSIDFLIGAIRASRDLHPAVQTELEEILNSIEEGKHEKTDGFAGGHRQGQEKGIIRLPESYFRRGGYDLAVVRLKKAYESGQPFDLADMEGAEVVLHFCDRESLQLTADTINRILKNWK